MLGMHVIFPRIENTKNCLFKNYKKTTFTLGLFHYSENDWAKVLVQIGILSLRLDWSDPTSSELECRY